MSSRSELHTVAELASGGMGRVSVAVRVRDRFQRLYAVKRLLPKHADDTEVREMFVEEARIAGHLRHPNVVGVLDAGTDDDGPFLVMEYVDGVAATTLIAACRSEGGLPLQAVIDTATQAARGLAAAHEACDATGRPLGIVHRDVSPHNVLIGVDGVARLTDFGIARAVGRTTHTSTGVLKGKLGYMAPEQLRFDPPSVRTDLFSLGVVIFELATGERLYPRGEDGLEGPKRILHEPPPDLGDRVPDAPSELVELLFELLAKEPDDRPVSAREVALRLEAMLADLRAREPRLDLGALVRERTVEQREVRAVRLREALAALERPAREPPKRDRRIAWALGAAMAIAVAFAGGVVALDGIAHPAPSDDAAPSDHMVGETVDAPRRAEPPLDPSPLAARSAPPSEPIPLTGEAPPGEAPSEAARPEAGVAEASPHRTEPVDRDEGGAAPDRDRSGARSRRRPRRSGPSTTTPRSEHPERAERPGLGTWSWDRPRSSP